MNFWYGFWFLFLFCFDEFYLTVCGVCTLTIMLNVGGISNLKKKNIQKIVWNVRECRTHRNTFNNGILDMCAMCWLCYLIVVGCGNPFELLELLFILLSLSLWNSFIIGSVRVWVWSLFVYILALMPYIVGSV